jgi:hypothetical protein
LKSEFCEHKNLSPDKCISIEVISYRNGLSPLIVINTFLEGSQYPKTVRISKFLKYLVLNNNIDQPSIFAFSDNPLNGLLEEIVSDAAGLVIPCYTKQALMGFKIRGFNLLRYRKRSSSTL